MPASRILVDSSFLVALYDKDADIYAEASEIAELYQARFLVPQVVLTEVVFLLKRETGMGGAIQFLDEFSGANPVLQEITVADLRRAKEVMQQYASIRIDFVDCCIVALAERLNITWICTLDRRDFSIVRPRHTSHFELFP